ncbi:DUF3999 family protein [Sulfurimonas sp.]|uniref:DUF3999 family protein n=1 Tax=Sulfurimonas sp. TaxID=2022749 RepID=UPI003D0C8411
MKIFLALCITIISLEAIEKNDFVYERAINTNATQGFVKVQIPVTLYDHLSSSSMNDLAIIDADNKVMPYSIEKITLTKQDTQKHNLPFSLFKTIKEQKNNSLDIKYQGTSINFSENKQINDEDYIVDASIMKDGIDYLQIKSADSEYMLQTTVACSDDLLHWYTITNSQMLANITMQESKILKERLNLFTHSCKYLKIHTQKPLNFNYILAVKTKKVFSEPDPVQLEFHKVNKGIEFTIPKQLPIQNLQFILPKKEQLYKLKLYAKDDNQNTWLYIDHMTIYTLQNGKLSQLESSLVTNLRHFRLEATDNSYLPEELQLAFKYHPTELYFLAQGKAPYTLVYDSIKQRIPQTSLKTMRQDNTAALATLGEEKVLNIDAKKIEKEPDYTAILVWISLTVGILILGFMSYRLVKELKE